LLESLDDEETKKLADCLEKILDIVGESMPEIQGWYFVKFFLLRPFLVKRLYAYLFTRL
jgi:hypothetical protein